jgi:hypothetical protein
MSSIHATKPYIGAMMHVLTMMRHNEFNFLWENTDPGIVEVQVRIL